MSKPYSIQQWRLKLYAPVQHVPTIEARVVMATKLKGQVVSYVLNSHGNHVVQCCIANIPNSENGHDIEFMLEVRGCHSGVFANHAMFWQNNTALSQCCRSALMSAVGSQVCQRRCWQVHLPELTGSINIELCTSSLSFKFIKSTHR